MVVLVGFRQTRGRNKRAGCSAASQACRQYFLVATCGTATSYFQSSDWVPCWAFIIHPWLETWPLPGQTACTIPLSHYKRRLGAADCQACWRYVACSCKWCNSNKTWTQAVCWTPWRRMTILSDDVSHSCHLFVVKSSVNRVRVFPSKLMIS